MTQDTTRRIDALSGARSISMALAGGRKSWLLAGLAAFLIALSGGRAEAFEWDAAVYWGGAGALVTGGDFFTAGGMDVRGVLSSVPYAPAALLANLTDTGGRAFVLVENALLIAFMGAVIIPALLRRLVPVTPAHIWLSAVLTAVLLAGFAPYPLMDLWAASFALGGLAILLNSRWWWALMGGVSFGIAVNLRPAYLLAIASGYVIWACFNWRRAYWPAVGAAVATVPQLILNLLHHGVWSASPVLVGVVTNIQLQFAAYVVRYDTVAFVGAKVPQQFYCSPGAAEASLQSTPASVGELALHFINNFPTSLALLAQKTGASLQWDTHTPYAAEPSQGISAMTVLVVLVSAAGLLALVKLWVERKANALPIAVVLVFWLGSLLTILGSTPEARFALPLLLIGIVGCLVAMPTNLRWRPRRSHAAGWGVGVVVLAVALVALGLAGTTSPALAGAVDASICAAV
ncbi:hypothetical protein [Cryobacterium sp. Y11]|uniref:hypothetical protein n=1 Tax=Cryobacterium sp. Y11 TaxID=2045016 RepID=UPI0011B0C95F|nr:hypothetical protein [Cryobacterium sp. Y11]